MLHVHKHGAWALLEKFGNGVWAVGVAECHNFSKKKCVFITLQLPLYSNRWHRQTNPNPPNTCSMLGEKVQILPFCLRACRANPMANHGDGRSKKTLEWAKLKHGGRLRCYSSPGTGKRAIVTVQPVAKTIKFFAKTESAHISALNGDCAFQLVLRKLCPLEIYTFI